MRLLVCALLAMLAAAPAVAEVRSDRLAPESSVTTDNCSNRSAIAAAFAASGGSTAIATCARTASAAISSATGTSATTAPCARCAGLAVPRNPFLRSFL